MRLVAMLTTHNEERLIAACLTHLIQQGCEVHLCDDGSTDGTVRIAEAYLGHGVTGIEHAPHDGIFHLRSQLERKETLAASIDADWYLHVDTDEFHFPPRPYRTLVEALGEVGALGYNAVNFQEFTFLPTRESPDHEHVDFQHSMRSYYPFLPEFPHRLNAWRRQPKRVQLAWSGGHRVRFPGLRMYPRAFGMRHYLFLSLAHAREKYGHRLFDAAEVARGWHSWRPKVRDDRLRLPTQSELRLHAPAEDLDASAPWTRHYCERWMS